MRASRSIVEVGKRKGKGEGEKGQGGGNRNPLPHFAMLSLHCSLSMLISRYYY